MRPPEVGAAAQALERRDMRLWSLNALLLLVVGTGFVAVLLPNAIWKVQALHLDPHYVPQLLFGFMGLLVLYNIYALEQRRALRSTREELLRQFLRTEAAEKRSLIDPLTDVFNRRYFDEILSKEVSRADRTDSNLSFLFIDMDNFKSVNERFGHLVGDRLLNDVAQVLTATFRKSDAIVRYGGDEFVVLLPDTNETQAERAYERLLLKVGSWNREHSVLGYQLSLSCGLSTYKKGANVLELLEAADKSMYVHKARLESIRA